MSDDYNPNSIDATLARMEGKLNTALEALSEQNRRLIILEVAENKRTGALIAIGTVCTIVGGALTMALDYFKGK